MSTRRAITLAMREIADLAQEWHPEDALVEFEALLLDREAVLTRISWLGALAGRTEQPSRVAGLERIERDYAEELAWIDSGLLDAYLEGHLPDDWGARLGRLARDAQALWVAHTRRTVRQVTEEQDASLTKANVADGLFAPLPALEET